MATKARHLKTPMQRWVFDHLSGAKDLAQDIATEAEVSVETVRGWQSRGRPNEDAIRIMERRFGEAAPREDQPADTTAELVSLVGELLEELRADRKERVAFEKGLVESLRELAQALGQRVGPADAPPADARR